MYIACRYNDRHWLVIAYRSVYDNLCDKLFTRYFHAGDIRSQSNFIRYGSVDKKIEQICKILGVYEKSAKSLSYFFYSPGWPIVDYTTILSVKLLHECSHVSDITGVHLPFISLSSVPLPGDSPFIEAS